MSRNASGVYTLPQSVNPVVTRTTITTDWANTTLNDIKAEITLSLDRSGRGAMTAPLQINAGTAALPGLTIDGDTNTGIYGAAADSLGFSTAGTNRMTINVNDVRIGAAQLLANVGVVGAPGLSFTNDPDCGLYRAGSDDIRFSIAGADKWKATAAGVNIPAVDGLMSITAATAATGATRQTALALTNGDLSMSGVVNPDKDVAMSNVLSPKHIAKAWALFTVTGGGGVGNFSVTFTEGLNITSIARQSSTLFRVTFASAFASTSYIPVIQAEGVSTTKPVVSSGRTTTVVDFAIQTVATGASTDLDASAVTWVLYLVAFGPQ